MWFDHGTAWGWMMFAGMLVWIVFWIALIAVIAWGIMWGARTIGNRRDRADEPSALEIARARYARGEITKDEFEEIRRTLQP